MDLLLSKMSFFTMKSGVMIRYLMAAESPGPLCVLSERLWQLGGRIVLMILLMITVKSSGLEGDDASHEKRDLPSVLVFTTLIEPPFIQKGYDNSSNREILEGFIPDLVEKIALKLKMPYRLKLVSEGGYGTQQQDGTWNGMLGEIMRGEADVAAGALSVRPWREKIVDFTVPFMESGIATVVKRPGDGSSLPIQSPRELLNKTGIRYGCIPGSLTQSFFRTSPDKDYRKMWHIMSTTLPSVFEWTSRKGIARVRESNGRYVFMLESVFANYLVGQPPCDLVILDFLLNPSEYAFALQKGSNLTKKINRAMTQLKEAGVIDKLYRKWWKSKCTKRLNRKHNLKDESLKDDSKSGRRGKSQKKKKDRDDANEEIEDTEEEGTPPPRQHHRKLETRTISLRGGCQRVNIMTPLKALFVFLISLQLTYLH